MELAFINTNHPDFIGGDGAISKILDKMVVQKQEQQASQNPVNTNPFVSLSFHHFISSINIFLLLPTYWFWYNLIINNNKR